MAAISDLKIVKKRKPGPNAYTRAGSRHTGRNKLTVFWAMISSFVVPIDVLRGALAHTLDDLRVLSTRRLAFDGHDVDLMPPVVAEIKPVTEGVTFLESQGSDGGAIHVAGRLAIE